MDKKYDSFKELPKKITDKHHVLYLSTFTEADIEDVLYEISLYCQLTDVTVTLLKTCRAGQAHGFIRKKASELGCAWRDLTKSGYGEKNELQA